VIDRLAIDPLDPRTYGRILYLLLALPLGIVEFTFLVTAISLGVGLTVTLVGIPILIATMVAWRWLAGLERRLIGTLTGTVIASPYRGIPEGASWWTRLRARLADPATWKDLVFLLLQLPLGIVSFTVAATVLGIGLGGLTAPAWYWALPEGIQVGIFDADTLPEAFLLSGIGAIVLRAGIPALGALGQLYGAFAALLLGSNADPEPTAKVSDLRDARSRIIAAADAERRRIERDLHDGAQQRLVALALQLRMAEQRAAEGDPEAAELVRSAGKEAGLALEELRNLARGIHPAILTNRGLPAAIEDLAARATVPVEVAAVPGEHLPDAVEAAAYFVVSECLANVSKHAGATSASVAVTVAGDSVTVAVGDDGVGGVTPGSGSGLQGLEDRVGALDGSLTLESPPGQGTRVLATIPLAAPATVEELPSDARRRLLPDVEAAEVQARRRRGLRTRLTLLVALATTVVVVWALTGAPGVWPIWPLLGLGLIAGVDAWVVLGNPPLRESDLAPGGDLPTLRRRRRLRLDAGVLAIVDLTLIGIWLAAGAGYFRPVWPLLGTSLAIGLKALRRPGSLRQRLLGHAS
jgi:signal transduction histidine kinase